MPATMTQFVLFFLSTITFYAVQPVVMYWSLKINQKMIEQWVYYYGRDNGMVSNNDRNRDLFLVTITFWYSIKILVVAWYAFTMYWLSRRLNLLMYPHYDEKVYLLWWPFALLGVKHMHCCLLDVDFAQSFGLASGRTASGTGNTQQISPERLCILCYLPVTIIFRSHWGDESRESRNGRTRAPQHQQQQQRQTTAAAAAATRTKIDAIDTGNGGGGFDQAYFHQQAYRYVVRGLTQLTAMLCLAQAILLFPVNQALLDHAAIRLLHPIINFYQVTLATGGMGDILCNASSMYILSYLCSQDVITNSTETKQIGSHLEGTTDTQPIIKRIVPVVNVPALTSDGRNLWARWSTSVGYHLRVGIYDRLGGYHRQFLATAITFAYNCVLHIIWWGPIAAKDNTLQFDYISILFVAPMSLLALDKCVLRRVLGTRLSQLYRFMSFALLHIAAILILPQFLRCQGLPEDIRDLAYMNTGRIDFKASIIDQVVAPLREYGRR